jgi:protein-tyrosine phosphatase
MTLENARNALVGLAPAWLRGAGRTLLVFEDRQNAIHEWRRARAGSPRLEVPIRRVLVICYGNICRSPFAAELLARRVPSLEVRSAGLEARDGKAAEPAACRMALRHGIDLRAHAAHQMRAVDVGWADLIVAMEGYQCSRVRQRWPEGAAKTHLLGDFFERGPFLIVDPYGSDDEAFATTFDRIAQGVEAFACRVDAVVR